VDVSAVKHDFGDSMASFQEYAGEPSDNDDSAPTSNNSTATDIAPIDWLSKVAETPPERLWFLDEWLPAAPTLFAGMGGVGKTAVIQTMGTAFAFAKNYVSRIRKPLKVLIWLCEDTENEIWRRQVAICDHFDLSIGDLAGKLIIEAREGCDNTLLDMSYGAPTFTPLLERLREQINDYQADVFVLDNLGQAYGGKESDRHQATKFVNGIKGLVRGRPFAPILIGHTARSEGSEYSGSAAWENACRSRWYLGTSMPGIEAVPEEERESDVIYLAKRKANYSVKDHVKLRYTDGLFLPELPAGVSLMAADRDQLAEDIVLKGFDKLQTMGIKTTDGTSSPDYLPKQLMAKKLSQGHTTKELASAVNRLMSNGRFARGEIGKYANRSPKFGIVRP
jgi:RecA-family ATPase